MIVISQPDPNGTERNELESILVNVWFIVYLRIKEIYLSINGFDWAYFTVFIQRFWLSVWTGILLCSFAPEIPHADSELNYTHRTLWANCANDHALFFISFSLLLVFDFITRFQFCASFRTVNGVCSTRNSKLAKTYIQTVFHAIPTKNSIVVTNK